MDTLIKALDDHWVTLRDNRDEDNPDTTYDDSMELVMVLQRILRGRPILKAFGAPGDWGYGTPIGDGLLAAIRADEPDPNRWHDLLARPADLPDAEIQVLAFDGERHLLAYIGEGDVWMEDDNDEPISFVPVAWRHLDNPAER